MSSKSGNQQRLEKLADKTQWKMTKSESDYKTLLKSFLTSFVKNHLDLKLDILDKQLFILESGNVTSRISPDIQGNITKSVMYSGAILKQIREKMYRLKYIDSKSSKNKGENDLEQDITKLMEGYKYYGKDIDVNEWYRWDKQFIDFFIVHILW